MKTITAKYPGRCIRTGASIRTGDLIIWHGRGRAELASTDTVDPTLMAVADLDPELVASDPDAALAAGKYMARSMRQGISDIWRTGNHEFYRNKRGRCEDAPCCGCCNS